jgi:hypothetical protein
MNLFSQIFEIFFTNSKQNQNKNPNISIQTKKMKVGDKMVKFGFGLFVVGIGLIVVGIWKNRYDYNADDEKKSRNKFFG